MQRELKAPKVQQVVGVRVRKGLSWDVQNGGVEKHRVEALRVRRAALTPRRR